MVGEARVDVEERLGETPRLDDDGLRSAAGGDAAITLDAAAFIDTVIRVSRSASRAARSHPG